MPPRDDYREDELRGELEKIGSRVKNSYSNSGHLIREFADKMMNTFYIGIVIHKDHQGLLGDIIADCTNSYINNDKNKLLGSTENIENFFRITSGTGNGSSAAYANQVRVKIRENFILKKIISYENSDDDIKNISDKLIEKYITKTVHNDHIHEGKNAVAAYVNAFVSNMEFPNKALMAYVTKSVQSFYGNASGAKNVSTSAYVKKINDELKTHFRVKEDISIDYE